jgi:bifunctional non-homologous end joining protein LigD
MPSHSRALPAGFVTPCLPSSVPQAPSGQEWLHEIKHDGFRVITRKNGERVRLYSRPGNDLTDRFPLIVDALARLRPHSCIIDGEAVACGNDGIASFDRIRYRHHDASVFLYAFDLIELDSDDLRRDPLAVRKATLVSLLSHAAPGLRFNEHLDEHDGALSLPARLQARARRHCKQEAQLALPIWTIAGLDQEQEPSGTGSEDWGRST